MSMVTRSLTEGRMMRQGHLQRAFTLSLVLPRLLTPGTIFCIAPLCSRLPAASSGVPSEFV